MTEHSAELDELGAALAKAQAAVRGAKKDSANPFFKSSYADLSSVWEACRDALTSNGLSVIQLPGFENGIATVETILLHSSGQWVSGKAGAPLGKQDAQGVGSVITYLRRYALQSVAGVAAEDDDGNAAVRPAKTERGGTSPAGKGPRAPVAAQAPASAPTVPPHVAGQPLSEKPPELRSPDPEPVWPFGKEDRGKLLSSFTSEQLVKKRQWLESKNASGDLTRYMDDIDNVLSSRGGL